MAKLLLTGTLFFFILALSHARTPLDLPVNDVAANDLSTNVQEADPKTTTRTIFLPSEKPVSESEREPLVDVEPEKTESGTQESETKDFVPLTVINFRSVSRQFPRRPSLTFRHRRPCHEHRFGKPSGPIRFPRREISYGNDMISSSDDNNEVREIPARWVKFHHSDTSGPRFPYWRDDGIEKTEDFKRLPHFPHHHHHHHHHHHDMEGEEEREGHEHERGFLMKIRKFLNHF